MNISKQAKEFIENREWNKKNGLMPNGLYYTYKDWAGIDTIGIGHANDGRNGAPITYGLSLNEVYNLFDSDLQKFQNIVNNAINVEIPQSLYDGLVAFAYRTGATNSELYNLINLHKLEEAKAFWVDHYISVNGVYSPTMLMVAQKEMKFAFSDISEDVENDYVWGFGIVLFLYLLYIIIKNILK